MVDSRRGGKLRKVVVPGLLLVLLLVGLPAGAEWLRSARVTGGEARVIGALKQINTAQTVFREGALSGTHRYGSLEELLTSAVLETEVVAAAREQYELRVAPSTTTAEYLWFATANPLEPGSPARSFGTNHTGVIYYTQGPVVIDEEECDLPVALIASGYLPRREPERY